MKREQQAEGAQRLAKVLRGIGPGNRRQAKEKAQTQPRSVAVAQPHGRQPEQAGRKRSHHAVPQQRALKQPHLNVEQREQPQHKVPGNRQEGRRRPLLAVDLAGWAKRAQHLAGAVHPLRPRNRVGVHLGALANRLGDREEARLIHNVETARVGEGVDAEEQCSENENAVKARFDHAVQIGIG